MTIALSVPVLQSLSEILGGGALLVLGLRMMSEGLKRLAGSRFRSLLEKATSNRLTAALFGAVLSAALHSPASAAILTVGFLNAGLISIYQGLSILIGISLGTIVTVQLIAFKLTTLSLLSIFIGVLLKLTFKRRALTSSGDMLLGIGIIFLGMGLMESGFGLISQTALSGFLEKYLFSHRIGAALFGSLLTLIAQSPSAAAGIIIALADGKLISFFESIVVMSGANLGVSLIALIAAFGASVHARRVVLVNLLINLVSLMLILLFLPLLMRWVIFITPYSTMVSEALLTSHNMPSVHHFARLIANAHTSFSLFTAIIFLPLIGFLARAPQIVKNADSHSAYSSYLDKRILDTPSIALLQAYSETRRLFGIVEAMYFETVRQLYRYDARGISGVMESETGVDILHRELSGFLVLLSREELEKESVARVANLMDLSNRLEEAADAVVKLLLVVQKKKRERIQFSSDAMVDVKRLAAMVTEVSRLIEPLFDTPLDFDKDALIRLENSFSELRDSANKGHLIRMKSGLCTVEAGFFYNDLIGAIGNVNRSFVRIASVLEDGGERA